MRENQWPGVRVRTSRVDEMDASAVDGQRMRSSRAWRSEISALEMAIVKGASVIAGLRFAAMRPQLN